MFLRLYLGLLVTVLTAIVLCYLSYVYINEKRLLSYEASIFSGTFKLIQAGLSRHRGQQQEDWLSLASRLSGLDLKLRPIKGFDFDHDERSRLLKGEVLFRSASDKGHFEVFAAVPGAASNSAETSQQGYRNARKMVTTTIKNIAEQQLRVAALLTLNEIGRYQSEQTATQIERLQRVFSFPVRKISDRELQLDRNQLARLRSGAVVVAWQVGIDGEEELQVMAPIGGTDSRVLQLGPIPPFVNTPLSLLLTLLLFGLLITAAGAYLMLQYIQRRVEAMSDKVAQFGKSEFDVRIDDRGKDEISHLAQSFDRMADRIVHLMTEQKHITQAVSHELRTPMSRMIFRLDSIAMRAAALEDNTLTEKAEGLRKDLEELNSLVDETLVFHQLDTDIEASGRQFDGWEQVDVTAMLASMRENLAPLYPDKSLIFEPDLVSVRAIPRYLNRLSQNLISNALRFAQSQVRVKIGKQGEHYRLTVEDDGPGVAPGNRSSIFDPYMREDSCRNRKSGGYGLGLAIVKKIAALHGGDVDVAESELGGARFEFGWPATDR